MKFLAPVRSLRKYGQTAGACRTLRKKTLTRRLHFDLLEDRYLLSGDVIFAWTNLLLNAGVSPVSRLEAGSKLATNRVRQQTSAARDRVFNVVGALSDGWALELGEGPLS